GLILAGRMTVQKLRMSDQSFFRVLLAGHFVLTLGGGDQLDPLFAGSAQRPFLEPRKITRQLMKLHPLPLIAGMIVALGALNLNAQEDARGLGGLLVGSLRATVSGQGEGSPVLVRLVEAQ